MLTVQFDRSLSAAVLRLYAWPPQLLSDNEVKLDLLFECEVYKNFSHSALLLKSMLSFQYKEA